MFWNDELIGKTTTVYGSLNPNWEDAMFDIRLDPEGPPVVECSLRIEVCDWDKFSADDPLGQVRARPGFAL